MSGVPQLSRGSLDLIFHEPEKAAKMFPVPILQVLQIKQMAPTAQAGGERYRIVVSDGEHYVQTMLGTQANYNVHDGKLQRGSIIRIKQFNPNQLKGRNILIILDLDVIESWGIQDRIGDPTAFDNSREAADTTTIAGSDFYGAKKEEEFKPRPQAAPARTATHAGANIYPIEGLSPFAHKWTIKARVTSKSDIRKWNKPTGEGKLFSVNLLDESGEIRATGFNDQVDAFFDLLQEGSVYYISTPCKVGMAKKQFSNLSNDYELIFEKDTVIERAEDQNNIPQVRFNFCTIQELQSVDKDSTVDVIGVLKEVGEIGEIVTKTDGRPLKKRELTLVDDTGYSVRLTVWGKTALGFDANVESVLAFKGTKVSDFGGRSLSLVSAGTMSVNPDIPDAYRLKGWYDSTGRTGSFATHQNMSSLAGATGRKDEIKTIAQVKDENLGMEEPVYYAIKATIVFVKQENFCYPACASGGKCAKKVVMMGDGTWHCENCNASYDKPNYRYILQLNVADHTSHQWLSCFDDTARLIVGMSANELMEHKENDDAKFTAVFESVNCKKLNFRCRARMSTLGDSARVQYQVMSATMLDYKAEGDKLTELINQYKLLD